MTGIPALTLHRPWAELILAAGKDVENRTWSTKYRGPLLIHAGKTWDRDGYAWAAMVWTGPDSFGADWISPDPDDHATGIVGIVDLVDVLNGTSPSPWAMRNQFHWRLTNPRMFAEAIPCRGFQQLWTPPAELQPMIDAAVQIIRPAIAGS